MPKCASSCKISGEISFRRELIVCFRVPCLGYPAISSMVGSSRLEWGPSGGAELLLGGPHALRICSPWHGFKLSQFFQGFTERFPAGVRSFPYKDCRILKHV